MSIETKREYTEILRLRYRRASRQERPGIIDELCANTGMHRKSAIRLLRKGMAKKGFKGRKKVYSEESVLHLRRVWIASDQMCGKNLARAMPDWLEHYIAPDTIKAELIRMSPATIDRSLRTYKVRYRRTRRAGTKPGSLLKTLVPIKSFTQLVTGAGFVEADTVAHCGGTLMGDFTWSLTFTDTFSGWTENRAIWGKSGQGVYDAVADIEKKLPFEIKAFNCDNGSEFLNHQLVHYFNARKNEQDGKHRYIMTRSRAYQKNDNCHVEQKNWTHVRQLFGYERFEFKDLVPLMNEVYTVHNLLHNFFFPQAKLKSKVRINGKLKKKYDVPKTPYHRLLEDDSVSEESKQRLKQIYATLNPFELRELREQKLQAFHSLKQKLKFIKEATDPKPPKNLPGGNLF